MWNNRCMMCSGEELVPFYSPVQGFKVAGFHRFTDIIPRHFPFSNWLRLLSMLSDHKLVAKTFHRCCFGFYNFSEIQGKQKPFYNQNQIKQAEEFTRTDANITYQATHLYKRPLKSELETLMILR